MKITLTAAMLALLCHKVGVMAFQTPAGPLGSRSTLSPSKHTRAIAPSPHPTNRLSRTTTALQANPFLALAASPVGSVAVLSLIVCIHEAGHYLAAKQFGIRVEEFSVGLGPKLFGFTFRGDDFNLRAFPLGGYVRFPENYNITEVQAMDRAQVKLAEEYIAEQKLGWQSKLLNALTLGAVEDKLWQAEKERRLAKPTNVPWWKRLVAKQQPTETEILKEEINYYEDDDLLQNRPWFQRAIVLSGGVAFNLLLAFSIYFGQISVGPGLPVPKFDDGIRISATPSREAPASGLVQKGDVIMAVNGNPVLKSKTAMESQKAVNQFIETIRNTPNGESIEVLLRHAGQSGTDKIRIQPKRTSDRAPQSIGVLLSPNYVNMERLQSSNPAVAANLAFDYMSSLTKETANGLLSFFAGLMSGSGTNGQQVSGPIGLIRTGSEVVASKDLTTVLLFAAAISINLGVINSIPLPALDGGQLVFVLAEALTGKRVDQRVQEGITGVAVFFLLLLSVGTFVGDLSSIFGR